MSDSNWYVLIHEIPARPLYFRVKIRKRLTSLGAIALKDSVYVAPAREGLLSRLAEIAEEAREGGGEAHILVADFVDARTREALLESFRRKRDEDYKALTGEVRALTAKVRRRSTAAPSTGTMLSRLARAKKRLALIERIDFFEAPARSEAVASVAALEELLGRPPMSERAAPLRDLVGRTWVTRRGIQVDRIASAWFIRRFIDPHARLRFMDPGNPDRRPGEITYDMVDGDFTHEEDRCTFETLIRRARSTDAALARLVEIVHEIDIRDGKYSCPETTGVQQVLAGMLMANPDDQSRLDRGFALFDDLYRSFHRRLRPPEAGPDPREGDHSPKGGHT
jgi:hypothetical protein